MWILFTQERSGALLNGCGFRGGGDPRRGLQSLRTDQKTPRVDKTIAKREKRPSPPHKLKALMENCRPKEGDGSRDSHVIHNRIDYEKSQQQKKERPRQ